MQDKQTTGKLGESLAALFLEEKGFRILHRNYRYRRAEIDLIAASNALLLFVEVKTRTGRNSFGYPEEAVTAKKESLITGAAEHYIEKYNWQGDIRFDIIAVHLSAQALIAPVIHHFEDAFY